MLVGGSGTPQSSIPQMLFSRRCRFPPPWSKRLMPASSRRTAPGRSWRTSISRTSRADDQRPEQILPIVFQARPLGDKQTYTLLFRQKLFAVAVARVKGKNVPIHARHCAADCGGHRQAAVNMDSASASVLTTRLHPLAS